MNSALSGGLSFSVAAFCGDDESLALIGTVHDVLVNDANFKLIRSKEVKHRPVGDDLIKDVLVSYEPNGIVGLVYNTAGKTKLFGVKEGRIDHSYSLTKLSLDDHRKAIIEQLEPLRSRLNLPSYFHPSYKVVTPFQIWSDDGSRNLYPDGCFRIHVRMPPAVFETPMGAKIATSYVLSRGQTAVWNLFYDYDEEGLRAFEFSTKVKNAIIDFNKAADKRVDRDNAAVIFRNILGAYPFFVTLDGVVTKTDWSRIDAKLSQLS
ncbi:hypothetical protein HKX48_004615 [Thoreauomyces humboldtii]|nr:hypothetical protein HKX48_004615 [Thoreauomyces humboldtii]